MNVCGSYSGTLKFIEEISTYHAAHLQKWINEGTVFKFWGDNVDKKLKVRDVRSDHQGGDMLHMYSILVARSRTQASLLPHTGQLSTLTEVPGKFFLPSCDDLSKLKSNLVILVSRIITDQLFSYRKVVTKHILHPYSKEMTEKSEVLVLDVLMKHEAVNKDMIDIMRKLQSYLGTDYDQQRRVVSGGDQLTCERQIGAQRHLMCGNTVTERLEVLEPTSEDWHFLVIVIGVSTYNKLQKCYACD